MGRDRWGERRGDWDHVSDSHTRNLLKDYQLPHVITMSETFNDYLHCENLLDAYDESLSDSVAIELSAIAY